MPKNSYRKFTSKLNSINKIFKKHSFHWNKNLLWGKMHSDDPQTTALSSSIFCLFDGIVELRLKRERFFLAGDNSS